MDAARFDREIRVAVPADRVRTHVPLAPLTTFRVGGPADWLVDVVAEHELTEVIAAARRAAVPLSILGGGSNVLVADAGVRGVVVRTTIRTIETPAPDLVRAGAGVTINGLVRWTVARGLASLETWAGTPGTVGGAIYGNAHFQGHDIGELVSTVRLVTPEGQVTDVPREQMGFGYDTSRLQETREVVVHADFGVCLGDPEVLRARARASLAFRKRTQPLALPSAGCVFQNPDPRRDRIPAGLPASAGALIDRAGLKGAVYGGARVSPVHANFIVNDGHATAAEIRALVEQAREAVRREFGVVLRDEVVYLGAWEPVHV